MAPLLASKDLSYSLLFTHYEKHISVVTGPWLFKAYNVEKSSRNTSFESQSEMWAYSEPELWPVTLNS